MSKAKVSRVGLDWLAECKEHNDLYWCDTWGTALEAAYGHVAMWHPRACDHEIGFIISDQHRCLSCGIELPPLRNLDTQLNPGKG